MPLVYEFEAIKPRELKPALLELNGISRAAVEAHYRLYEGYVNKRNEILGKLADADTGAANQVYSDVRALKVDLRSSRHAATEPKSRSMSCAATPPGSPPTPPRCSK